MQSDELQKHVFSTYLNLRYGLVVIGVLLPLVVWLVGWYSDGKDLQRSISAYYWTTRFDPETAANEVGEYWARVWLVGGLFAVASSLYLYKGFTRKENIALNLAAVFGLGVALVPTDRPGEPTGSFLNIHGTCAVLLFACLVFVVWFCARDTLPLLEARDKQAANRYRRLYVIIGLIMLASPVAAVLANYFTYYRTHFVFWVEAAGVWAFAAYWWVKSRELKATNATRKALRIP